jgi:hypothetical protein
VVTSFAQLEPQKCCESPSFSQTNQTEIDEQLSRIDENGPRQSFCDVTISRKWFALGEPNYQKRHSSDTMKVTGSSIEARISFTSSDDAQDLV